ncbi:MAG: cohesin domain-containing protein, partial [SAR202 cluster bacterium]|nr:cohesin domain-containing protein [SAR202 cluster bacterium]
MRRWTLIAMMSVAALFGLIVSTFDGTDRGIASVAEANGGMTVSVMGGNSGSPVIPVAPGGEVLVKIVATGAAQLAGLQFKLGFDPSLLQVVTGGVTPGDVGSGAVFQPSVDNEAGVVSVAFARSDSLNMTTAIVSEIRFASSGTEGQCSSLLLTGVVAASGSVPPEEISSTVVDGSLCVRTSNPPVDLSVVGAKSGQNREDVRQGETATMKLVIGNAGSVAGIQAKLKFDPAKLSVPSGGVSTGSLPQGFIFASNVDNGAGFVSVVAAGSVALGAPTAVVAEIDFVLKSGVQDCSNIVLQEVVIGDASQPPDKLQVQLTNGQICVDESQDAPVEFKPSRILGSPGHVFRLDLWTNVSDSQEVTGVEAYVNFDPTLLTVVDPVSQNPTNQIQPALGQLSITLANNANNTTGQIVYSAGTLTQPNPSGPFKFASVTFEINDNAPLDISTVVRFNFSGSRLTKVSVDGSVITGTHQDATVEINSGVTGRVNLEGAARPNDGFEVPVTVKFFNPGASVMTDTPVRTITAVTAPAQASAGTVAEFFLSGVPTGSFDVTIDSE